MKFGVLPPIPAAAITFSGAFAHERVVTGTAGTVGELHPTGAAMAETINLHVDGVSAPAGSTSASPARPGIPGGRRHDLKHPIQRNRMPGIQPHRPVRRKCDRRC